MVYRFLIAILFSYLSIGHAQDQGQDDVESVEIEKETINLVVGIKKIIKLDFDADFNNLLKINNVEDKLDMKPAPDINEIIFEGKTAGSTNVIIKDKAGKTRIEYNVVITETDQSKMIKELRELIGDIEGVRIEIRAGKVVIDGEVIVPREFARLVVALEKYQNKDVIVLVEPSPHTMSLIAKRMQDEIQANGIRDVTVRVVNDAFWIEGVVNSQGKKLKATEIATALLPNRIVPLAPEAVKGSGVKKFLIRNFVEVNATEKEKPLPKLVKIATQFVELSKDYARTFGFRWSPSFSGGGGSVRIGRTESGTLSSSSEGSLSAVISNLFPKLAAARNAGNARVLQSGIVITEDNVEATVSKTTTIPFDVGSGEFSKGQEAQATFKVTTTPVILKQEKVKLSGLDIAVSAITGQNIDGNPLQTTNAVRTNLIVNSGDSAVVGGIFQSQSNSTYDKLPGDTEEGADYLFNFVRAKNYKTSKSQFVVFVTPEVVDSASKGIEDIKRKFRMRAR